MDARDLLVQRARHWCEDVSLGYDQARRWDIRDGGTCDCSSLGYWLAWEAGFLQRPADYLERTLYTGTIAADLVAAGWSRLAPTVSALRPADYLLSEYHHVAICVSGAGWGAWLAEANIDERGRPTDGTPGDQTGRETRVCQVYEHSAGWDCILRPPSGASPGTGALEVDGWLGAASVAAWQRQLGTVADGVVSGQVRDNAHHFRSLLSVGWERSGSAMVAEVQRRVGAEPDGILGPLTVAAVQRELGVAADGYLGYETACAIQCSVNEGRWA